MEKVEEVACFGGQQQVWVHNSDMLGCSMRFAVYLPPQASKGPCPVLYWLSGLTCTEQNFITKAGAQRYAAEHGLILVAPDTSPRGDDIADDEGYDLGKGAGFYLNATKQPWAKHYQMYDYIVTELPALIESQFATTKTKSIFGHSMGGHGALMIALKNPGMFKSVSAFAPIVAPTQVPWGHKAFGAYLGDDRDAWKQWDTCELIEGLEQGAERLRLLVDQGESDPFLKEQLQPERLIAACAKSDHPLSLRMQPAYDHSYYFIASFMADHIAHHAKALRSSAPPVKKSKAPN